MRLTVSQLRRIIKEEVSRVMGAVPADVPADYEACGTCGYDHEYEPAEAQAAHKKMGDIDPMMM